MKYSQSSANFYGIHVKLVRRNEILSSKTKKSSRNYRKIHARNESSNLNQSSFKQTKQTRLVSNSFQTQNSMSINKRKWTIIFFLGLLATTAMIVPNIILYFMLPSLFIQSVNNHTNTNKSIIYAKHCAGVSPYTKWIFHISTTIMMSINTSNCYFNKTPMYFSSILGHNLHTDLNSYNAIYSPYQNGYAIYVRSTSGMSATQMLNYSSIQQWNVSWVGVYY